MNGLEVFEEEGGDAETKTFAPISSRKRQDRVGAAALPIAFGAAGSAGAQVDLGDARPWRAVWEDDKTKIA